MPRSCPDHADFIRAVRRRLAVVRAAECIGWSALVTCAVALPLVLIQSWRGASTLPLLTVLVPLGIMAAAALALHRWPSPLAAAVEADRQFGLADLLTTALTMHRATGPTAPDMMTVAVLATADARCRELWPSDLVLNRLGARAWGGIGLSVALVLTVAIIPLRPTRSDAAGQATPALTQTRGPQSKATQASRAGPLAPQRPSDPTSESASRLTAASAENAAASNAMNPRAGSDAGAGSADARTTRSTAPPRIDATETSSATAANATNSQPAGGAVASGGNTAGGSVEDARAAAARPATVAPWKTGSAPPASHGDAPANEAAPDAYRDLLREYFKPQ